MKIKHVDNKSFDYKKTKLFLHCKECIEQFLNSELHKIMTPKEYGLYEVGISDFTYSDGTVVEVVVVWCKRCGKKVWDGRDLTKT